MDYSATVHRILDAPDTIPWRSWRMQQLECMFAITTDAMFRHLCLFRFTDEICLIFAVSKQIRDILDEADTLIMMRNLEVL